jgi:hypothetical protein
MKKHAAVLSVCDPSPLGCRILSWSFNIAEATTTPLQLSMANLSETIHVR